MKTIIVIMGVLMAVSAIAGAVENPPIVIPSN